MTLKMSAKERRTIGIIGFCVLAGIILYIALKLYPGPFRYWNLPEAEWNGNEVLIGEKAYTFYGPLEDGMQMGELVAYWKDSDGYYSEFYSVKGYGTEWIVAKRRVVMGDTYLMRESL